MVAAARESADLTVVLGGGHETAYGSHLGLGPRPRLGVLNLDAHFDLREAERPTSGTPFRQIAADRHEAGVDFDYAVVGISRTSNTSTLFDTADELGVRWLLDDDCQETGAPVRFVEDFLAGVDAVYLTIDLDVLPAAVAPGVSAPAALGFLPSSSRRCATRSSPPASSSTSTSPSSTRVSTSTSGPRGSRPG